ncbi:MAG: formylglycine-generating enzyme family protein [Prevotellaceae bacterium]|nr:formylglycine-generating enzyme family protein [Prevotellaceae bacterium]
MKPVTGGVFYMGNQTSNSGNPNYNNTANAYTVHQVALSSFYMSETEITQKMYQTVMNIDAPSPNWDAYGKCPTCAAYRINWYDAIAFCNKLSVLDGKTPCYTVTGISDWVNLAYDAIPHSNYDATWNAVIWDKTADGYRLATEAEWEYAARGGQKNRYTRTLGAEGTQYVYSGSNNLDSVAWHSGNGSSQSHPVKSKKANELGLYDMSGNVWEYCWDWAGNAYSTCCVESPDGGGSTTERVMRGGCWYVGTYRNSVSERFNPSGMWNRGAQDLGFRIARSAL